MEHGNFTWYCNISWTRWCYFLLWTSLYREGCVPSQSCDSPIIHLSQTVSCRSSDIVCSSHERSLLDNTASQTSVSSSYFNTTNRDDTNRLRYLITCYGLEFCSLCMGLCSPRICHNRFFQGSILPSAGSQRYNI